LYVRGGKNYISYKIPFLASDLRSIKARKFILLQWGGGGRSGGGIFAEGGFGNAPEVEPKRLFAGFCPDLALPGIEILKV
jgi:hypothetical protein